MRKIFVWTTLLTISLATMPAMAGWDEGVAAFTAGKYQAAVAEFQELVSQNPEGYRGHYMLGLSLQQLDRREEALNHLRKAYDLNPNDLSIKLALGRAYSNLRRYSEVSKLLSGVDASSLPAAQQAAFYQMRGEARFKNNDEDGAVSDFGRLARLRSNDAKIQYLYGTTALRAGQLDEGIAALDKAYKLATKDEKIIRAYSQALIKKGRLSRDKTTKRSNYLKASELAQKLVAVKNDFDNNMLLISAQLGAGAYDGAVQTGKKLVGMKDGEWLAHFYLGQAYSSTKEFAQAEAPLLAAKERTNKPDDLRRIWDQLGFVYEKQKKYSQSIEAYQFAGNQGAVARVQDNEQTANYNKQVEEENKRIQEMEEEARRLEEELKALEGGGGGR